MPRFLFWLALLISAVTAQGILCPKCDTLNSEKRTAIVADKYGDFDLCQFTTRRQGFSAPDTVKDVYQIRDSRQTLLCLKAVIVPDGQEITLEQANEAWKNPGVPLASSIKNDFCGPPWLIMSVQGIVCRADSATNTLKIGWENLSEKPKIALQILVCLIAIILLAGFCAYVLPKQRQLKNSAYFTFMIVTGALLAAIVAGEIVVYLQPNAAALLKFSAASLAMKLLAIKIALSVVFILLFLKTVSEDRKEWNSLFASYKKSSIKATSLWLGFVTLAELIIFIGLLIGSWFALLFYFGIADLVFILFALTTSLFASLKKKRLYSKKEKVKPFPSQPDAKKKPMPAKPGEKTDLLKPAPPPEPEKTKEKK